ncbi:hypothetical protein [Mitsuokella sp. oral taxon 131]|uniref:hypothetical protein n=1 Tax=Mitsuokella sp. oral taxon 131 TaxID=1321780 RepID=UPI000421C4D5|nr:hypothetical protein [Mitsuokella sp. oral taxon 131]
MFLLEAQDVHTDRDPLAEVVTQQEIEAEHGRDWTKSPFLFKVDECPDFGTVEFDWDAQKWIPRVEGGEPHA